MGLPGSDHPRGSFCSLQPSAEGYERESNRDCINVLAYAKGSAGELRTQIYIGIDIGYIDRQTGKHGLSEAQQISKMLAALIKARKAFNP